MLVSPPSPEPPPDSGLPKPVRRGVQSGGNPSRIGKYPILGELGRGGMGVVYRALDTALDREVAIKVLPERFSRDPDRLSRFQREARILASLNHPNIASIYSLETLESGLVLLVLDTLRQAR